MAELSTRRITTRITWDMNTGEVCEHSWYLYPADSPMALCCGGGPSREEKAAQKQAAEESKLMEDTFKTQFGEIQGFVNNFLAPELKKAYMNPTGYGADAIAAMERDLVNTSGIQAANARQQAKASFDTNNMAGLPSGVEQVVQSQINSASGNQIAQGVNQIELADAQAKFIQKQNAMSGLMAIPGMLGAAPQVAPLLTPANQNQFKQADIINQEAMAGDFWGNLGAGLLSGVIKGGLNFATGGFSNMLKGLPFMGAKPGGGGDIGGALFGLGGGGQAGGVPLETSQIAYPF